MTEENAPLEKILEAAEAAVAEQGDEKPQVLIVALGAMALLIACVAVVLGIGLGSGWRGESRAVALAVPPQEDALTYAQRVRVEDEHIAFSRTMFDSRELRVSGTLRNSGDRVVANAKLVLVVKHLFGDERYEYAFAPVSPLADGVGNTGPLLAGQARPFSYRVPDVPADISSRVVRISWRVEDIAFHSELPIPTTLPVVDSAA